MEEYAVVFAESKRDRWRLKLVGPLQPGQNIDEGLAVVQSATSYSTELAARSVWENVLEALACQWDGSPHLVTLETVAKHCGIEDPNALYAITGVVMAGSSGVASTYVQSSLPG